VVPERFEGNNVIKRSAGTTVLAGLVLVGAGAVSGFLLRETDPPPGLRAAPEATSAPVSGEEFSDERTVKVATTVAPAAPLVVGARGRVTALSCKAGRPLKSGAVVARIDEIPLVALATKIPLYRDLNASSRGRDVESLQRELRRLGYSVSVDGRYGQGTRAAVKELQRSAGVTKPDGTLRFSQVLWLPMSRVVPDKCSMIVGKQVGAGEEYATIPKRLTAIQVSPMPAYLAPGRRTIVVMGRSGPMNKDGTVTDQGLLSKVSNSREFRDLKTTDDAPSARITLTTPLKTVKVPPSAVFAIDETKGCLQSGQRVIPVKIVGSKLGTTLVLPEGATPSAVNLGASITAKSCGHA
jgi:peptidoglycan hydrolase-like protein with peptidoglycan-binding domain